MPWSRSTVIKALPCRKFGPIFLYGPYTSGKKLIPENVSDTQQRSRVYILDRWWQSLRWFGTRRMKPRSVLGRTANSCKRRVEESRYVRACYHLCFRSVISSTKFVPKNAWRVVTRPVQWRNRILDSSLEPWRFGQHAPWVFLLEVMLVHG